MHTCMPVNYCHVHFVYIPAVINTTLTESTLKNVPQVVNVQEFKDKGPPVAASSNIR